MRIRRGSVIEGTVLTMGYKGLLAIIRGVKPILGETNEETKAHLDAVNG